MTPDGDRLESWKEIASFLDRDERTAMRWARERGMPVHRVPGGKRSTVFAFKAELTDWMAGQPEGSTNGETEQARPREKAARFRRGWIAAGAATVALAMASALVHFSYAMRPRVVSRVTFTDNTVQAWDAEGQKLWVYTYPARFDRQVLEHIASLEEYSHIGDFRGDREKEVLVMAPFRTGANSDVPTRYQVDCFSSRGERLWSYVPEEKFQFGQHELEGPWAVTDLFVSVRDGKPAIWAVMGHEVWGNTFVAQLDPETGKDTVRFMNTGTIYKLGEMRTARGTYLLAAGFNNEYEAGALAVMDESRPFAASPQTEGTRHKCDSCPAGDVDAYLVFPRSEINVQRGLWQDPVRHILVDENQFEVAKWELEQTEKVTTIYRFALDGVLKPISLRYSSDYDMLHRELSAAHKLNHSLENCPERMHPQPVRMWTPSGGWKELAFPPARASD